SNIKLLDKMPQVYAYPGDDGLSPSQKHSAYFVFSGPQTAFAETDDGKSKSPPRFTDITDGASNTLATVEARREVPWTKPEDIFFDPSGQPPDLGGFYSNGFNAGFADGSVRFIRNSVGDATLRALITRAGGEVLSTDAF